MCQLSAADTDATHRHCQRLTVCCAVSLLDGSTNRCYFTYLFSQYSCGEDSRGKKIDGVSSVLDYCNSVRFVVDV